MKVEISSNDGVGMLAAFAEALGSQIDNGKVPVPEKYGSGYMRGIIFEDRFRMMIRDYVLKEDFSVSRKVQNQPSNMLLFTFYHIIHSPVGQPSIAPKEHPSVQITTQGLNGELFVPAFTRQNSIAIIIDAAYLKELIGKDIDSVIVKNILENRQQLLFEAFVFAPLQKVVDEVVNAQVPDLFSNFYYKLKTQELLCQLLIALVERDEKTFYNLHIADVKTLYKVKERLLENLDQPPGIEALVALSGMSESKLKRLFKQVFGKSIFSYFQGFRMQEAARLLKEERLSVSDAGFQLGFSNLSHFTRVFEEHMGVKPKKFSMK